MPRIPHRTLLSAYKRHPFLPLVLRGCRDLPSAESEFRWLIEHVLETLPSSQASRKTQSRVLLKLCKRRENSEPLQYILGSQPFGELDIKCRRGVLIPRSEPEAYTAHIASLILNGTLHRDITISKIQEDRGVLRILDIGTGTGCIPLLLHSLLSKKLKGRVDILGVDISDAALSLAKENIVRNAEHLHREPGKPLGLRFEKLDILKALQLGSYDIVISNPPYISPTKNSDMSRSVRKWEPREALIPPGHQDMFYEKILQLVASRALLTKFLMFETAGGKHAFRIAASARGQLGQMEWRHQVKLWGNDLQKGSRPRSVAISLYDVETTEPVSRLP